MALQAGEVTLVLEYARDLKDHDWFGKQDPYAIITCGHQTRRSRTAVDGGRNPVWNESFKFNVINENDISILLKDEDVFSKDDIIGTAQLQLARARIQGRDQQQLAVVCNKKRKQHGYLHVSVTFIPNSTLASGAMQHAATMQGGGCSHAGHAPLTYSTSAYYPPPATNAYAASYSAPYVPHSFAYPLYNAPPPIPHYGAIPPHVGTMAAAYPGMPSLAYGPQGGAPAYQTGPPPSAYPSVPQVPSYYPSAQAVGGNAYSYHF